MEDEKQTQIRSKSVVPTELDYTKIISNYNEDIKILIDTWNKDTKWKLLMRKIFTAGFSLFLILQNGIVYYLIYRAYFNPAAGITIADLQVLLSVLIAGTIGQTIMIVKIMVQWIFTDIQYSNHPLMAKNNDHK